MVFGLFGLAGLVGRKATASARRTQKPINANADADPTDLLNQLPFMRSAQMIFGHPFLVPGPYEGNSMRLAAALDPNQARDVIAAYDILICGVWAERIARGYPIRTPTRQQIMPEIIPQGLVIDRIDDGVSETIIYADDVATREAMPSYHAGLKFSRQWKGDYPARMPSFAPQREAIKALQNGALVTSKPWGGRYRWLLMFSTSDRRKGVQEIWMHSDSPIDRDSDFVPLMHLNLRSMTVAKAKPADAAIRPDRPDSWT